MVSKHMNIDHTQVVKPEINNGFWPNISLFNLDHLKYSERNSRQKCIIYKVTCMKISNPDFSLQIKSS